jgi:flavin reductase (DIM6/NTAB) family NADH-FMN oxidoreductase RutF
VASGVYVITYNQDGEPEGILTTWIAQSAFEPPLISVAVKDGRPFLGYLKDGAPFVVNILSKTNNDIFKQFARPGLSSAERFAGLELLPERDFGAIFAKANSHLLCHLHSIVKAGDHNLVLAEISGGGILQHGSEPMVHFRANGFQY